MIRKTVPKLWVGVGAAVLAGAAPSARSLSAPLTQGPGGFAGTLLTTTMLTRTGGAPSGHSHAPDAKMAPGQAQGGEGGEGGEAGVRVSTLTPEVRFYHDISLIRGHLLVGDELVKGGNWNAALPHFLHPTEELYALIKSDLRTYKVRPFESALKALAQTVKAKSQDAYASSWEIVQRSLSTADESLKTAEQDWDVFVVEVALEVLRSATGEYQEALADGEGKITNPVEYQDSRGFVWQAERMIESVAPALEQRDRESLAEVREAFAELKKAWPDAMPPTTASMDLSAVLGAVANIELHAGNFLR